MSKNVKKGMYRNSLGVELHVIGTALPMNGWPTLGGDIAVAEDRDDLFPRTILVTEASLTSCGYELIEESSE